MMVNERVEKKRSNLTKRPKAPKFGSKLVSVNGTPAI